MRTQINNISLICLEPNGEIYHNYDNALKLNYEHYKKVMEAKRQVPFAEPKSKRNFSLLKEGDYVYIVTKSKSFTATYNRPLYGWIKIDKQGRLYVLSFRLIGGKRLRGEEHTFIPEKDYLFSKDGEKNQNFAEYSILFSVSNS